MQMASEIQLKDKLYLINWKKALEFSSFRKFMEPLLQRTNLGNNGEVETSDFRMAPQTPKG